MRSHRLVPGCWRSSSLWSVDQEEYDTTNSDAIAAASDSVCMTTDDRLISKQRYHMASDTRFNLLMPYPSSRSSRVSGRACDDLDPGCIFPCVPMEHLSLVPRVHLSSTQGASLLGTCQATSPSPPLGLSKAQQHKPTLHLPLCLSLYLSASIPVGLYTCLSLCFSVWPGESCKGQSSLLSLFFIKLVKFGPNNLY